MAGAIVYKEPPPIPGLKAYLNTATNQWMLQGHVDALAAAGAPYVTTVRPTAFEYPNDIKLYPFQEQGIPRIMDMLRTHGGAILADEMGLGKTTQGAIIGENLRGDHKGLVVCPGGIRHQWLRWLQRAQPSGDSDIATLGPPSEKAYTKSWESWSAGASEWGIVSYNLMDKALAQASPKPRVVLFDEIHNYMQGRGNKYVKAWWKHQASIQYRLALTGSPFLAHPAGLWQILNVLLGMRFGRAHDFDVRYCAGKDGTWGWDNRGASNTHELSERLKFYMVRRMKADVAKDLPKVTRTVRWVEGSKAEQKAAAHALANMEYTVGGIRTAMEPTLSAKYAPIIDFIEETGRPTVVFCWRRYDAELMGARLCEGGQDAMVIHGEWNGEQRGAMINEARRKRCHVVTTYGASATGLDGLQDGWSDEVFHAIDPVVATLLQAVSRLDRIGQTMPVNATFFAMSNSVDELTVDKVVNRIDTYEQILGRGKSSTALRDAMTSGGVYGAGDKFLDAIFSDMTGGKDG